MTRSPRNLATEKIQLRKQQEKLLSDLLTVVDALDRAADHWHQAEQRQVENREPPPQPLPWWQKLQRWFSSSSAPETPAAISDSENLTQVVSSAREGIDMIRNNMLTVLNNHQVVALPVQGEPFDPTYMHALGQQPDSSARPNTVIQEVLRGYRWKEKTLREAQVIVASAPSEPTSEPASKPTSESAKTTESTGD